MLLCDKSIPENNEYGFHEYTFFIYKQKKIRLHKLFSRLYHRCSEIPSKKPVDRMSLLKRPQSSVKKIVQ
jgi:hypothetical protein